MLSNGEYLHDIEVFNNKVYGAAIYSGLFYIIDVSDKSKTTALLLCLFLGGIGIHRFYLGYKLFGLLQILTLGGFGIWALIDLIRIFTGKGSIPSYSGT